jgi:hypothetical protein
MLARAGPPARASRGAVPSVRGTLQTLTCHEILLEERNTVNFFRPGHVFLAGRAMYCTNCGRQLEDEAR